MESFKPKSQDKKESPVDSGDSSTSKDNKKTPNHVPLFISKEQTEKPASFANLFELARVQAEEAEKAKEDDKPKKEKSKDKTEKPEVTEEASSEPEVANEQPEFLGELIIDHSDEGDDDSGEHVHDESPEFPEASQEPLDTPEAPVYQPEEDNLYEEIEEAELPPSLEFNLPNPDVIPNPTFYPTPEAVIDQPENQLPPNPMEISNHEMVDPNSWRSEAPLNNRAENVISEHESNRRAHRAEKRGLSRGVVTGGLVGFLLGRRGKKSMERQLAKTTERYDKDIKQAESERYIQEAATKKRVGTIERIQKELREMVRSSKDNQKPARAVPLESRPNIMPTPSEVVWSIAETTPVTAEKPIENIEVRAKTPVEERTITEQTYQTPEGVRVETSAWHRIEVDEKTGKAIENPTVAYGEAFKNELQQERLQKEASKVQTAAQVGLTIMSADQIVNTDLQDTNSQNTILQTTNSKVDFSQVKKQLISQTTNPLTWVVAVIIVIGLVVFGALG